MHLHGPPRHVAVSRSTAGEQSETSDTANPFKQNSRYPNKQNPTIHSITQAVQDSSSRRNDAYGGKTNSQRPMAKSQSPTPNQKPQTKNLLISQIKHHPNP